jgi:hypothetical protein
MQRETWPFTVDELELLMLALSPAYVLQSSERAYFEACEALGVRPDVRRPDAVLAAPMAYRRIRRLVVRVVRWIRARERGKLLAAGLNPDSPEFREAYAEIRASISQALRAVGYVGAVDQVWPLEGKAWREWAPLAFPAGPYDIHHTLEVPHRGTPTTFMLQVAQAGAEALFAHPELNRCHLQGRTYCRQKTEVLFYTQIAPDEIRFPTLDPLALEPDQLLRRYRQAIVDARKSAAHPLAWAGNELMSQWLRAGFVVSPAGLAIAGGGEVSAEGGLPDPKPALAAANGVPFVIGIGAPVGARSFRWPRAKLVLLMDHRVFDAHHGLIARRFLEERLR